LDLLSLLKAEQWSDSQCRAARQPRYKISQNTLANV
jgi:hypothetical protein